MGHTSTLTPMSSSIREDQEEEEEQDDLNSPPLRQVQTFYNTEHGNPGQVGSLEGIQLHRICPTLPHIWTK